MRSYRLFRRCLISPHSERNLAVRTSSNASTLTTSIRAGLCCAAAIMTACNLSFDLDDLTDLGSLFSESDAGVPTVEEASASLNHSMSRFLSTSAADGADDLDASMSGVFASNGDVEDALDAALAETLGKIQTEADFSRLIEQSLALNSRVVQAGETPGEARATTGLDLFTLIAQQVPCDPSTPTTVIFVNGVNNSYPEFSASLEALRKVLVGNPKPLLIEGYYNVSGKDRERSIFGGWVCPFFLDKHTPVSNACRNVGGVALDVGQAGLQFANQWVSVIPDPLDSARLRDRIVHHIELGRTVVVVAHSQGNFMAREALADLTEADGGFPAPIDSIGVISVGSPTSRFATSSGHTVPVLIAGEAMDLLAPGTWESNSVTTDLSLSAVERHAFNESYLSNRFTRPMIVDAVRRLSCELKNRRLAAEITGLILDAETGTPVARAEVTVTIDGREETTLSLSTGSFSLSVTSELFDGGEFSLRVSHPDYVDFTAAFSVTEEMRRAGAANLTIRLPRDREGSDFPSVSKVTLTPPGSGADETRPERVTPGESITASWEGGSGPFSVTINWSPGQTTMLTTSDREVDIKVPEPDLLAGTVQLLQVDVKDQNGFPTTGFQNYSIFAVPPVQDTYRVYDVPQICDGQLEVRREADVDAGIDLCSLGGGGLDCSIAAIFNPITAAYDSPEKAVAELCPRLSDTRANAPFIGTITHLDGELKCVGTGYDLIASCGD